MNRTTKIAGLVALALASAGAHAQVYKCQDAKGKITYTGQPCADIGQKSAGEVKDSVNVSPAMQTQGPRPEQAPAGTPRPAITQEAAPAASAEGASPPGESGAAADNPNRRCFTVKTAKGTTTRCNDGSDATPDPGAPSAPSPAQN